MTEIELSGTLRDRVENVLPAEHGRQGGIASAQSFANGDDVRLDRQLMSRQPAPHPPHSRDDLVEANQETVLLRAFLEYLPESPGWGVCGQGRRAHRLTKERRDRLGTHVLDDAVQFGQCGFAGGVELWRRGREVEVFGKVGLIRLLQRPPPPAERERAEGRPVIGLRRRDDAPALRLPTLDVIGARQPDRRFVGFGAA